MRYIGVSNYTPERIAEWFRITNENGLHRAVALQPHYNLVERETSRMRFVTWRRPKASASCPTSRSQKAS